MLVSGECTLSRVFELYTELWFCMKMQQSCFYVYANDIRKSDNYTVMANPTFRSVAQQLLLVLFVNVQALS